MAIRVAQLSGDHVGRRIALTTGSDVVIGVLVGVEHEAVVDTTYGGDLVIGAVDSLVSIVHAGHRVTVRCGLGSSATVLRPGDEDR